MAKKPAIAVRNPAASADAFVARAGKRAKAPAAKARKAARHPDIQTSRHPNETSEHPDIQTSNTSFRTRRDGTVVQRCSLYLPKDVKRALKLRAVDMERDESDIVTELVCSYLGLPVPGARP